MKAMILKFLMIVSVSMLVGGCATNQLYDYSAYKQSRPRSILVLPPVNNSTDVSATYSMLSQTTYPLAEAGYYVFPVTLVNETFKQNGLNVPADIHAVAPSKLKDIFGADSALYITITQYGTKYIMIDSVTTVSADAKLIDLKTEKILWQGTATATNKEGKNDSSGGLMGVLISAVINQVVSSVSDESHKIAGVTAQRLLSAGRPKGILYGPRSPNYEKDEFAASK